MAPTQDEPARGIALASRARLLLCQRQMREDRVQVARGAVFFEIELAVDVVHVVHHQAHRLVAVAGSDGVDQLVVLVVGTVRTAAAFVLRDDQRSL